MSTIAINLKNRTCVWRFSLLLFLLIGSWGSPAGAASPNDAPPVPAGMSRVWFLNQLIPGTAMHAPMIYVNGTPIAISPEGTVFYRNFIPGHYVFSIENCLPQPGTSQQLTLPPNTQFALVVLTDQNGAWDCEPSQISYLRQLVPQDVGMEFAPLTYLGAK